MEHFIEGGQTIRELCQQEVEPACKVGSRILIPALAQALSFPIQVEDVDHGEGCTTPPEGSGPRSAFSAGLDTRTPSTNRPALPSARR